MINQTSLGGESFITSITDSGSLDEGILVKDGYEFSDDNTKKAMEEYNKQGEEYAKKPQRNTSIWRSLCSRR